ncbi:hypothetical protein NDU88_004002 [Pleurodeles waltl]|uniref:Uncharacterized protein n=1 Tax=Pleurodeles waltl TaxID=8319 RepID=A0AAV7M518_PLEWA|nr:hypothetical protein NDU88_004002 [Pleurodeles waltl]
MLGCRGTCCKRGVFLHSVGFFRSVRGPASRDVPLRGSARMCLWLCAYFIVFPELLLVQQALFHPSADLPRGDASAPPEGALLRCSGLQRVILCLTAFQSRKSVR